MEFKNPLKGKSTAVKILVVIGIILVVCAVGYVIAITYLTIGNTGTIQLPASLSANLTSLAWGTMAPGGSKTLTVALTNTGGTATNNLIVGSTLSGSIGTLSNDIGGTSIAAGATVNANFTLTISSSATPQSFSFNITISD